VYKTWQTITSTLTKLVDCKAECGSSGDHCCTAVRTVKELEQSRNQLILILIMTETTVAAKAPREYPILAIHHDLQSTTNQHGEIDHNYAS